MPVRLLLSLLLGLLLLPAESDPLPQRGGTNDVASLSRIVALLSAQVAENSRQLQRLPELVQRLEALEGRRSYPRLSQKCATDSECRHLSANSECRGFRCRCSARFWSWGDRACRASVPRGQRCEYEEDCSTTDQGLTCANGTCALRVCASVTDAVYDSYTWRLVGGTGCDNGYPQVNFRSFDDWRQVCDAAWTESDATAACRSMGFVRGEPGRGSSAEVDTSKHWAWSEFVCSGQERSLWECQGRGDRTSCPRAEAARVTCYN